MLYIECRQEIMKNEKRHIHKSFESDYVFISHSDNHYGMRLA